MEYIIKEGVEEYTKKKINVLEIKPTFLIHTLITTILQKNKERILFINIKGEKEIFNFDNDELKVFLKKYQKNTKEIYKISIVNKLNNTDLINYNQNSFSIELFQD